MMKKVALLTSVAAGEMILREQQQIGQVSNDNKNNDKDKDGKSCGGDDEDAPSCESDEDKKKREAKKANPKSKPKPAPVVTPTPTTGGDPAPTPKQKPDEEVSPGNDQDERERDREEVENAVRRYDPPKDVTPVEPNVYEFQKTLVTTIGNLVNLGQSDEALRDLAGPNKSKVQEIRDVFVNLGHSVSAPGAESSVNEASVQAALNVFANRYNLLHPTGKTVQEVLTRFIACEKALRRYQTELIDLHNFMIEAHTVLVVNNGIRAGNASPMLKPKLDFYLADLQTPEKAVVTTTAAGPLNKPATPTAKTGAAFFEINSLGDFFNVGSSFLQTRQANKPIENSSTFLESSAFLAMVVDEEDVLKGLKKFLDELTEATYADAVKLKRGDEVKNFLAVVSSNIEDAQKHYAKKKDLKKQVSHHIATPYSEATLSADRYRHVRDIAEWARQRNSKCSKISRKVRNPPQMIEVCRTGNLQELQDFRQQDASSMDDSQKKIWDDVIALVKKIDDEKEQLRSIDDDKKSAMADAEKAEAAAAEAGRKPSGLEEFNNLADSLQTP